MESAFNHVNSSKTEFPIEEKVQPQKSPLAMDGASSRRFQARPESLERLATSSTSKSSGAKLPRSSIDLTTKRANSNGNRSSRATADASKGARKSRPAASNGKFAAATNNSDSARGNGFRGEDAHVVSADGAGVEPSQTGAEGDRNYSRKHKSLGLLCQNFLSEYGKPSDEDISLDAAANLLGVERRRIYDIVNVLESVGVVVRRAKNRYCWMGKSQLDRTLAFLMQEQTPADGTEDSPVRAGSGAAGLAAAEADLAQDSRKEKALGVLSQKFVQLFLRSPDESISLDQAALSLFGKPKQEEGAGDADENSGSVAGEEEEKPAEKVQKPPSTQMKTRVRRLYDVANILASLQLIEKTQTQSLSRKPAFRWCGPKGTALLMGLDDEAVHPTRFNAPPEPSSKRSKASPPNASKASGSSAKGNLEGSKTVGSKRPPPSASSKLEARASSGSDRAQTAATASKRTRKGSEVAKTHKNGGLSAAESSVANAFTLVRWKDVPGSKHCAQAQVDPSILRAVAEYEQSLLEWISTKKSSPDSKESSPIQPNKRSENTTDADARDEKSTPGLDHAIMTDEEVEDYMAKARAAGPEYFAKAQVWQAKFELWKSYHRSLSRATEDRREATVSGIEEDETVGEQRTAADEGKRSEPKNTDGGDSVAEPHSSSWQLQFRREQQLLWACALAKLSEGEGAGPTQQCKI